MESFIGNVHIQGTPSLPQFIEYYQTLNYYPKGGGGGHYHSVGLARTLYIRCIYGIFGRETTKYTGIYSAYIRFWPTLPQCAPQTWLPPMPAVLVVLYHQRGTPLHLASVVSV